MATRSAFRSLVGTRLAAARRRVVLWGGLSTVALALPWVGLVLLWLGWPAAAVAPSWRLAGLLALLAGLVVAGWFVLASPLAAVVRRRRFVAWLDQRAGARNLLVAAEEIRRRPDRWDGDPVARRAAGVVGERAASRLAALDVAGVLGLPGPRDALRPLLLALLLSLPALLLDGTVLRRGVWRLRHPLRAEWVVPSGGLYAVHGPTTVPAHGTLVLEALDFGTPRGPVVCEVREGDGPWRPLPARPVPPDSLPAPCRRYRTELADVRHDLVYRFARDGMTTPPRSVRVLHPPLLTRLDVVVAPPPYTHLPPDTLRRVTGGLEVLAGSILRWRGTVSHPLAAAYTVTAAGDSLAWHVRGDTLERVQRADTSVVWRLLLRDRHGVWGGGTVTRRLDVVPDRPPAVTLAAADGDTARLVVSRLRLAAGVDDDLGLARVELLLRREGTTGPSDTTWYRLPVWSADGGGTTGSEPRDLGPIGGAVVRVDGWPATGELLHVEGELTLVTRDLALVPGDVLAVCLEARDNRPGRPGRGRSGVLRFLVPGRPELAARQEAAQDSQREVLDDLTREGRRLAEELAALRRRLLRDTAPDFSERQRIAAALARQRELQRELAELARRLQEQMDEAARNDVTTPELLDRADAIARELAELRDSRTEQLQRMLQEALADSAGGGEDRADGRDRRPGETPDSSRLAELLQRLGQRQQEALDRMARARSLLEELQREQRMTGLVSSLEDMLRRQQALRDAAETPPATPEQRAEQARRQEALAAEMDRLQQQMQQALDELGEQRTGEQPSPAEQQMRQALQEALEALREQKPQERMRQAAREMNGGEPPPPGSPSAQREALRALASLYHIVLRGQQAMQMAMQNFAADTLRRLAFTLLDLSFRQERLADGIPDDLRSHPRPELAREQKRILRHLVERREELGAAVGASAKVPFRLLQQLDGVAGKLSPVVDALTGGWGHQARGAAREGLAALNQLVMNMLTSAQMTGNGGQGSQSLPQLAQQLQQMSQQQAALNAATEALQRKLMEQATEQARAAMPRLQAQQQALAGQARAADELRRSLPDGDRLLGDLRELATEMESVARAIGNGEVDEQVLRRQERILGRLLDAQHSVRQKDYEQRRRGTAARTPLARQEGRGIGPAGSDAGRTVRAAPLRVVPPRYRDLVRDYFRAVRRWLAPPREVLP